MDSNTLNGIAIIGMSGRFPNAENVREFWSNLCNGVDCISTYSDDELRQYGISESLLADDRYVKAKGEMKDIDAFDAKFFGYTPAEAKLMDPQHRKFLECCWEAMEDAGYNAETLDARVGVFAGESMSTYMIFNVLPNINTDVASAASLQAAIGNDKDSLTTTVTYKMDLKGAGITIQSSSSTSLTSIVMACQSLMNYQNDMILAGGVSISSLQKCGYLYEEQGILSPNGKCCPYDKQGNGFVPGTGVGVVVLKRLDEAIEDGDHIYAVIRGYDTNNDGSRKVSYSAPSVSAQTEVIVGAQQFAGFEPETITYIEGHGTATKMGDVIETKALKEAFSRVKEKRHCILGSVKGNIGHLDSAAGVVGVIKAALCVEKGVIPPTLNFTENNELLGLEDSPFYVTNKLVQWETKGTRRAGVSSFGMGGTNAHIVLEEYVPQSVDEKKKNHEYKVVLMSAQNEDSLDELKTSMDKFLSENTVDMCDLAYTSQIGRKHFDKRRAYVCKNAEDFYRKRGQFIGECKGKERSKVFMFPGQGAQFFNMGKTLYQEEKAFRKAVDECVETAGNYFDGDILDIFWGETENTEMTGGNSAVVQVMLFIIEYATARMLISYNVQPDVLIGHSVGEYVAACISEAISLKDAIYLIVNRGRLMEQMKEGMMVSIFQSEESVKGVIGEYPSVSIAAQNYNASTVIAGDVEEIQSILKKLDDNGVLYRVLKNKHAFHSKAVESIKTEFAEVLDKISFHKCRIPVISNVNGKIVDDFSKDYFLKHLESSVRFMDGIQTINEIFPDSIYIECGPGNTLTAFVKRILGNTCMMHTLMNEREQGRSGEKLCGLLALLWVNGTAVDWNKLYTDEKRQRISYPAYVFRKERYWLNHHNLQRATDSNDEKIEAAETKTQEEQNQRSSAVNRENLSAEYVAPENDIQRELCHIWESMLEIYPIGIRDNFFELGADSLMVTQLLSRIYKKYGIHVEYKPFFADPTILMLSTQLKTKKEDKYDIDELAKETMSMSETELDQLIKLLEQ